MCCLQLIAAPATDICSNIGRRGNVALPAGTILTTLTGSASEATCLNSCIQYSGCLAAVWVSGSLQCRLHSQRVGGTLVAELGSVTLVCNDSPPSPPLLPPLAPPPSPPPGANTCQQLISTSSLNAGLPALATPQERQNNVNVTPSCC